MESLRTCCCFRKQKTKQKKNEKKKTNVHTFINREIVTIFVHIPSKSSKIFTNSTFRALTPLPFPPSSHCHYHPPLHPFPPTTSPPTQPKHPFPPLIYLSFPINDLFLVSFSIFRSLIFLLRTSPPTRHPLFLSSSLLPFVYTKLSPFPLHPVSPSSIMHNHNSHQHDHNSASHHSDPPSTRDSPPIRDSHPITGDLYGPPDGALATSHVGNYTLYNTLGEGAFGK